MNDTGKQKLSNQELAKLLNLQKSSAGATERQTPEDGRRISRYDFTQPSRFNRSELKSLHEINESLAQRAGSGISGLIEAGLKVRLDAMDQMKWGELTEEPGNVGPGFAFKMNPGKCECAFFLDRRLAVYCIDRLTGGAGTASDEQEEDNETETDELTQLEQRLLVKVAGCFLDKLPGAWAGAGPIEIAVGAFVSDFSSNDLMSTEEDVLLVSFVVQGAMGTGRVGLAVPFRAVQQLPTSSQQQGRNVAQGEDDIAKSLRRSLEDSPITLTAVLGRTDMKVADLLNIEIGDVLLLGKSIDKKVDLLINERPKLEGSPGISSGKYAVIIDNQED